MPRKLRQGVPDPVPLALLGRLAVDNAHKGQGIGRGLLKDALRRVAGAAQTIGCRAVLVHAIDDDALAFYLRYGFLEFPSGSRTLFLPLETVIEAAS